MTDGENTQTHVQGNGRVDPEPSSKLDEASDCQAVEPEPHCIHLVEATAGLLAECHRARRYLTTCGELLDVSELEDSDCEGECEREIIYCTDCLDNTAKRNADAGMPWCPGDSW